MTTHLSYSTYRKLCEKFGKEKIDTFAHGHVFRGFIDNGINIDEFPLINMNGILSKEFVELFPPEPDIDQSGLLSLDTYFVQIASTKYNQGGMPAVEEYILSLL